MIDKYAPWAMGLFLLLGFSGMMTASLMQNAGVAAVTYNTIGFIGVGMIGIAAIVIPLIAFVMMPAIESRDRPEHKR